MIQVHKDVLDFLGIEHAFLTGEQNCFCNPVEISENSWFTAIDADLQLPEAVLHVKYRGAYLDLPVTVKKKKQGLYLLNLDTEKLSREPVSGEVLEILNTFRGDIRKLEEDHSLWNHRSEQRYPIGVDFWNTLGLSSAEQKVILAKTGAFLSREQPLLFRSEYHYNGSRGVHTGTGGCYRITLSESH
jgi:hypothetical protein